MGKYSYKNELIGEKKLFQETQSESI